MSINSPLLCSRILSVRLKPTYSLFCAAYFDVKTGAQMPTNRLWRDFRFKTYVYPTMAHNEKNAPKAVCDSINESRGSYKNS